MALVTKVKKVSVADLLESMEVQLSINRRKVARTYKLKMKLKETEFVSSKDIKNTLEGVFLKEMEAQIENHLIFLSKISGIKNFMSSSTSTSEDADEEDSGAGTRKSDDDDEDDDDDEGDDLGSDTQKKTDEMNYGNESDVDHCEDELSADTKKGASDEEDHEDMDTSKDEGAEHSGKEDETRDEQNANEGSTRSKKTDAKIRRAVKHVFERSSFEVHFKFTTEPHVLLAQVLFS